jgi:hypothetical protein
MPNVIAQVAPRNMKKPYQIDLCNIRIGAPTENYFIDVKSPLADDDGSLSLYDGEKVVFTVTPGLATQIVNYVSLEVLSVLGKPPTEEEPSEIPDESCLTYPSAVVVF